MATALLALTLGLLAHRAHAEELSDFDRWQKTVVQDSYAELEADGTIRSINIVINKEWRRQSGWKHLDQLLAESVCVKFRHIHELTKQADFDLPIWVGIYEVQNSDKNDLFKSATMKYNDFCLWLAEIKMQ